MKKTNEEIDELVKYHFKNFESSVLELIFYVVTFPIGLAMFALFSTAVYVWMVLFIILLPLVFIMKKMVKLSNDEKIIREYLKPDRLSTLLRDFRSFHH